MRLQGVSRIHFKSTIVRGALVLILLGFVAVLPAAVIGPAAPPDVPDFVQGWAFDVRLAAGVPARSIFSLLSGSPADKRLYWDGAGELVRFESDDLTLVGTLYEPPLDELAPDELALDGQKHPGLILLHGSTPVGRKLGLYRMLGGRLAERGYVVLAIDLRGYGGSENPADVTSAADFDFVADVSGAVDYLSRLDNVGAEQISVIGHSFGGDVALSAMVAEPRLQKGIAIGPGRRFSERGGAPSAPEIDYFRRREMRYMLLWRPIPVDTFLRYRAILPIENHTEYFAGTHQPILLIDGELESDADRQFLGTIYAQMSEPKAYITLPNADHYANTANVGPLVLYDQRVVEYLVQEIETWLEE